MHRLRRQWRWWGLPQTPQRPLGVPSSLEGWFPTKNIIHTLQTLLFRYFQQGTGDRVHTRQKGEPPPVLSQVSSRYKPRSPSSDNLFFTFSLY